MKRQRNKGITLIALVITIIVLLILAGVSIATLTGENGILTKANIAASKTNIEDVRERINLQILESYDTNGNLNMDDLKENLENNLKIDTSNVGSSLPTGTIVLDEMNFYINEDGKAIYGENPITVNNYGEYIDLKTDLLGSDVLLADNTTPLTDWRIFYAENGYVYVILADNLPNSTGIAEMAGLTLNTGDFSKYGVSSSKSRKDLEEKLSSDWTSYIFSDSSLSSTAIDKMTAKGAPTLSEWIKSWNSMYINLYAKETSSGWLVGDSADNTSYFYTFSKDNGYENTLYFPHNSISTESYGYWLASSSARSGVCLLDVDYRGYIFYFGYTPGTYYSQNACLGVRPIVKIPIEMIEYDDSQDIWKIVN